MKKLLIPLSISAVLLSACDKDLGALNSLKVEETDKETKTKTTKATEYTTFKDFQSKYESTDATTKLGNFDSVTNVLIDNMLYTAYKNKIKDDDVERIVSKNLEVLGTENPKQEIIDKFYEKAKTKLAYLYYLDDFYGVSEEDLSYQDTEIYKGIMYKDIDYTSLDGETGDNLSLYYDNEKIAKLLNESREIVKNYTDVEEIDYSKYENANKISLSNFFTTESIKEADMNLYGLVVGKPNYSYSEVQLPYKNTDYLYITRITDVIEPTIDIVKVLNENNKYKTNIAVSSKADSIINEIKILDKNLKSSNLSEEFYKGLTEYVDSLSEEQLNESFNYIGTRAVMYKISNEG